MNSQTTSMSRLSWRVCISYIVDWVIVIIFAAIAVVFYKQTPHYHDFSVVDPTISYPLHNDTVSIFVCGIVAGAVPAVLMILLVLALVPGFGSSRPASWRDVVQQKLWEINAALLGLALSLATALMVAEGLKNFGKPRPNMLARCDPDIANIQNYVVGGYSMETMDRIVSVKICQQTDMKILNDGFQSFPSGHCTTSMAGLAYFALWLCAKFGIYFPSVSPDGTSALQFSDKRESRSTRTPDDTYTLLAKEAQSARLPASLRKRAAAPPLWILLLPYIPIGGALYICMSRYMDYAHFGFDIIVGSLLGITTSFLAFRLYHMPVGQSRGRAWGTRAPSKAFWLVSKACGYGEELPQTENYSNSDIEMGSLAHRQRNMT